MLFEGVCLVYTHVIRKACAVKVVCPGIRDSTSGAAGAACAELVRFRLSKRSFNLPKNTAKMDVAVGTIF